MGNYDAAESRMQKAVDRLEKDYAEIRAGRANPNVLDKVMVDYYGTPTPVNQLASVAVAEARILVITPWDKTLLKAIEKAIQTSDIGINPQNDGNVIRLTFPSLDGERRKELARGISKRAEEAKVAIRNVRRDALDDLKKQLKAKEITEDDLKNEEGKMQKMTDKFGKLIDEIAAAKEKEIMTV
ncbi:MAG TPA: ribosome recycling factor [Clostridiales bacterium]|mgnify:CR=1 FL=1|nr:ribosome recycling factor [Clostridiales bacterium]